MILTNKSCLLYTSLVMGCVFAIAFGWKEIRGGVVKACSAGLKNGSVALITVSAMIGSVSYTHLDVYKRQAMLW